MSSVLELLKNFKLLLLLLFVVQIIDQKQGKANATTILTIIIIKWNIILVEALLLRIIVLKLYWHF